LNAAHHEKLRAAGWHHDPVSDRYSAPDAPQDGTQRMYDPAEAWAAYQAAQAKAKDEAKDSDAH